MKAFLITPFTAERARETPEVFEAVQRAIAEAARRAGVDLLHPARMSRAGAIMEQHVQPEIEAADIVLALITGQNPNVFFELGFARRDAILICRSAEDVPFDIRHKRYWTYGTPEELASLESRLEDAIRQTLAAAERSGQRHQPARPPATAVDGIAAFVGPTERGPIKPALVRSAAEFTKIFGADLPASVSFLAPALHGFFANGGKLAYVARVARDATTASALVSATNLGQLVDEGLMIEARTTGAWGNRIEVELRPGTRAGLRMTIVFQPAAPDGRPEVEDYDNCSLDPAGPNPIVERINSRSALVRLSWLGSTTASCTLQPVCTALTGGLDGPPPNGHDYRGSPRTGEEARGIEAIAGIEDIELICVPDHVHPRLSPADRELIADATVAAAERDHRIALLATPPGDHDPKRLKPHFNTRFAAIYHPWVRTATGALVPPIGHIAGAFARSGQERGVHWAPIALVLDGVGSPALASDIDAGADGAALRDLLERLGLNVLATDPESGRPALVTCYSLAIDEQMRYLNMTRLANFIRRSLLHGLAWVEFEKNEPALWQRIEAQLGAFLTRLWEDGVLRGEHPEDAFFVRCDATTMTETDVQNGRVVLLLGIAAAAPVPVPVELPPLRARCPAS